MDDAEPRPVVAPIARFLDELALARSRAADSPASSLPAGNSMNARFCGYRNCRTAMNAAIVQHGNHQHGAGMHDVFAHSLAAVGQGARDRGERRAARRQ